MNALGGIAACLIFLYVGPLWAVLFVACVFIVLKLDRKRKVNEEQAAQRVAEAEYRRAEELDRTAAAERAARLLRSDDDPDGAGPV